MMTLVGHLDTVNTLALEMTYRVAAPHVYNSNSQCFVVAFSLYKLIGELQLNGQHYYTYTIGIMIKC